MASTVLSIVFRPGSVQGLGFRFWSGYRVIRINSFFKKNQNDIVLVKKNQRVATGFLTGSCRINRVIPSFFFSLCFFQPGPVPARQAGPGLKTIVLLATVLWFFTIFIKFLCILILIVWFSRPPRSWKWSSCLIRALEGLNWILKCKNKNFS
jgi:hypothetical protein